MITSNNSVELKIVPESLIVICASQFKDGEANQFSNMLENGMLFKFAGLTPVYLCDTSFKKVGVTCKEKLENKHH